MCNYVIITQTNNVWKQPREFRETNYSENNIAIERSLQNSLDVIIQLHFKISLVLTELRNNLAFRLSINSNAF